MVPYSIAGCLLGEMKRGNKIDFSKQVCVRIVIEIAGPTPLAVLLITLTSSGAQGWGEHMAALPFLIGAGYAFAILPSIAYAGIMELWFRKRAHRRLGLPGTVVLSSILGALSGFGIQQILSQVTGEASFLMIGTAVGAILGVILFFVSANED